MIGHVLSSPVFSQARLATMVLGLTVVLAPSPARASDPPERLTPERRKELERQASELDKEVLAHYQRGEFGLALEKTRRELQICERLYPRSEFPKGHSELAQTLLDLGILLQARDGHGEAQGCFERALEMTEGLYPKETYPRGHSDLARSLDCLGSLRMARGDYVEARAYYLRAVEMNQSLYPKETYPQGHPDLATALNNLGALLQRQGRFIEARRYLERALEIDLALQPNEKSPQGNPAIANSLDNLGMLLQSERNYGEARSHFQRALTMRQALYPKEKFPRGHRDLARSLNSMGDLFALEGAYVASRGYCQRALEMTEALYPKEKYPRGHRDLAQCLSNMGTLLRNQGGFEESRGYLERALEINKAIYHRERFPRGHPEVAMSLSSLGALHWSQGDQVAARGYLQQALEMCQTFYSKAQYPRGHTDLARNLSSLGAVLHEARSYGEAQDYLRRALEMHQALYPRGQYPQGHPALAQSLCNLGVTLHAQGSDAGARVYLERALGMNEGLYPIDQYPRGHPDLVRSLHNLGFLLLAEGDRVAAQSLLQRAVDVQQDFDEILLNAVSEAESLNYLAQIPPARDALISASLPLPDGADATYARIWRGKAAVARLLRRRQSALVRQAAGNPTACQAVANWRDTRGQLARLMLATADGRDQSQRIRRLGELTAEKERLERQLADVIPDFGRMQDLDRSPHSRLVAALADRCVVLDLVRYTRFEQDPKVKGRPGERRTPSYVGFVLAKGRPVRQVDLGIAQPIDAAVGTWRSAIGRREASPAAETLRRLVWEPLARHVPTGTTTVVVAPDGALSAIPWAALPGDRPGTVLLEQFAVASVPHAPFLLGRITAQTPTSDDRGILLAVGGVAYDQAPGPIEDVKTKVDVLAMRRADADRGRGDGWKELPGTRDELDTMVRLAEPRASVRLEGAQASTIRLLRELPGARWAHIATHGFFADPSVPSDLRPAPELFAIIGSERVGAGLRNPLVLSGLVLAGANRPGVGADVDGSTRDDLGILTAEAIAALPLQDLELVVLSACESGLGTVAGGEGVFGLQRAFQLAGAHNVVASLWKVDDQATAALMAIFYDQLWREKKPAIEALRTAQLTLYRDPGRVGRLARARGTPDFAKVLRRREPTDSGLAGPAPADRAAVKQWAAFMLSGWGR